MAQISKSDTAPGLLKRTTTTLTFAQQQAGLLVTNELNKAIEECRAKVKRISKECRMKNRKFRDIEFDLENDKFRCLEGLFSSKGYAPSDVQRVTQIFEKPRFYAQDGTALANNIYQGALGDCWFMSALATVSTCPGLVEKFCVERDEQVGVYGFIFFKDSAWVNVIIDDLLFTRTPKYEELKREEQELYHFDKESYNGSARKGGKQLYFAKSGDDGETWVPLMEKAYAKLHGNYASISGGADSEAVEDMTGGVSSFIPINDILDPDKFWTDELLRANKDRLFGCSFTPLSQMRKNSLSGDAPTVQGLMGGHAYSVLRAVECRGKRFVVVRNPWGDTEWTGPWSDGSKEWKGEWLEVLPELGHMFGDDGQFVMEYKDFLNTWQDLHRTILFDDSWVMSSQWLHVPMKPLPHPWQFGDLSFTFTLSGPSLAVIVLSQLDRRYFEVIAGRSLWSLDFVIVKEGEKEPLAESNHAWFYTRSVNLEIELEEGSYIVYVRVDRLMKNPGGNKIEDMHLRQLSRVLAEKSKSQSIASNRTKGFQEHFTPTQLADLIEKDYSQYEKKMKEKEAKEAKEKDDREAKEKAKKEAKENESPEKPEEAKDKDKSEQEPEKPKEETKAAPESPEKEKDSKGDNESRYASAAEDSDSDEEVVTTTTTTVVVKKVKKAAQSKPQASSSSSPVDPTASKSTEAIPRGGRKMQRDRREDPSPSPLPLPPLPLPLPPMPITPIPYMPQADIGTQTYAPTTFYDGYFSQDDHNLYLGLKVYTKALVEVVIEARLKGELETKKDESWPAMERRWCDEGVQVDEREIGVAPVKDSGESKEVQSDAPEAGKLGDEVA